MSGELRKPPASSTKIDIREIRGEGGEVLFRMPNETMLETALISDKRLKYYPIGEAWGNAVLRCKNGMVEAMGAEGAIKSMPDPRLWVEGNYSIPVAKKIMGSFPGSQFFVRGVATFLGDETENSVLLPESKAALLIPKIALSVAREKTEMGEIPTTELVENGKRWERMTIPWLFMHPQAVREELTRANKKDYAEKIFPMLVFYVADKTSPRGIRAVHGAIFDYLAIKKVYEYH